MLPIVAQVQGHLRPTQLIEFEALIVPCNVEGCAAVKVEKF
jgi:hypothetical protein